MSDIIMSPTEELVLEVLIARRRLGEQLWTFSNKPAIVKAAKSLENQGLVWRMGGMVEHTFRAGLTDEAVERYMSKPYFAPEPPAQAIRRYAPARRTPGGGVLKLGTGWETVSKAAAAKFVEAMKMDDDDPDTIVLAYQDTLSWRELPELEYQS